MVDHGGGGGGATQLELMQVLLQAGPGGAG
jgi:hypothetical protein